MGCSGHLARSEIELGLGFVWFPHFAFGPSNLPPVASTIQDPLQTASARSFSVVLVFDRGMGMWQYCLADVQQHSQSYNGR